MKKRLCFILTVLLLALAGCSTAPTPEAPATSTTLMIYLVGSDLEAKTGAASADLEEIIASGIDLTHNRVVVCAGASPYWVNETVDPEQLNILTLQEQGFQVTDTLPGGSMGTAQQLQEFLSYCHSRYAGDQFALILWDHGAGPVMGYGKDILYGNDGLLLSEIRQALEQSPFGPTEKLAWVGFDACLMASAELSCLFSDYAHYLMASQEVEPAFGWDYSFLSQLGKTDTAQLLTLATERYLAACQAYYASRNYVNYDVTLSVVDLSLADELETAINALFAQAEAEVEHYYDLLAKNRVQSRALGRATTGSEYDLVDLFDMAQQLANQYPRQCAAVQDVVSRMVVANATSMEHCCGMSLYYPFYNKRYYEQNWKQTYEELGLFPEYLDYLAGYEQTWLREDKLTASAMGLAPEQSDQNTFSVTLSPEQASSYASGQFHILRRVEGDIYQRVYNSQDVTWDGTTLTANYDGMAIYVNAGENNRFVLALSAVDQIDRLSRYRGRCRLDNTVCQPEDLTDEELPEEASSNWRYLLTLNRETGKVELSGTVPYDMDSTQELLESGRLEDAPFSTYGSLVFYDDPNLYITRYENGAIKPLSQWYDTGILTGRWVFAAQGYAFEYAPLADGEYYLTFEISDTQSAGYCTELLPITVEHNTPTPPKELPVTQVKWQAGENRVLLIDRDNIRLYLTIQDTEEGTRYFLDGENFNDYPVEIQATNALLNETLETTGSTLLNIRPQDFMYDEFFFGITEYTGILENLESLQLTVSMEHGRSGRILWSEELVQIDMTQAPAAEAWSRYNYDLSFDHPVLGALAEKQVLCETDQLRLTLLGFGAATENTQDPEFYFLAENLTEDNLHVSVEGVCINGLYFDMYCTFPLDASKQFYLSASPSALDQAEIRGIQELSFLVAVSEKELGWSNNAPLIHCPVTLLQAAEAQPGLSGKPLWEDQGVRLSLLRVDREDGKWYLLAENTTDRDISLSAVDITHDDLPSGYGWNIYLGDGQVGAGQSTICSLSIYTMEDKQPPAPKKIRFRFQVLNYYENQVLFTANEFVTLLVE